MVTVSLIVILATLAGVMCTIPDQYSTGKHPYYGHYPGEITLLDQFAYVWP